jgi:hypothetical protein
MFNPRTNDGYYELGLQTANLVREAIDRSKGIMDASAQAETQAKTEGSEWALKATLLC